MAENTTAKKPGFGEKVKKFFKDYKNEFKKITWPTVRDTNKNFLLVIVATAVVGAVIFGLDFGLRELFNLLG